MTKTAPPLPDVSDDPHAAVEAVANEPGERYQTQAERDLESWVSRLPTAFDSTSFRASPTPFLFWSQDPDGDGPDVPIVPRGRVVLLTGQGGTGKSHLSLSFAVCLAAGVPVGSFYVRPSDREKLGRGRSLVLLGEETPSEIEARLDSICRAVRHKTSLSGDDYVVGLNDDQRARVRERVDYLAGCGRDLRLTKSDAETRDFADVLVARVVNAAQDGDPYALVVLDPMTRFNGADENDNAAAARLVTILERLTNETRTTVVAVHHSGKGEGTATNARGASALVDNARCHLALQRGDCDVSELTVEKSNYATLSKPRGGAPRFWFHFVRPDGAAVSTVQELDAAGRAVVRETIATAQKARIEEAAVAKYRDREIGNAAVERAKRADRESAKLTESSDQAAAFVAETDRDVFDVTDDD